MSTCPEAIEQYNEEQQSSNRKNNQKAKPPPRSLPKNNVNQPLDTDPEDSLGSFHCSQKNSEPFQPGDFQEDNSSI